MTKPTTARTCIVEAFLQLCQTLPCDKITVSQLTKKAGYNRSTFYAYFNNTDDLLKQLENELFQLVDTFLPHGLRIFRTGMCRFTVPSPCNPPPLNTAATCPVRSAGSSWQTLPAAPTSSTNTTANRWRIKLNSPPGRKSQPSASTPSTTSRMFPAKSIPCSSAATRLSNRQTGWLLRWEQPTASSLYIKICR